MSSSSTDDGPAFGLRKFKVGGLNSSSSSSSSDDDKAQPKESIPKQTYLSSTARPGGPGGGPSKPRPRRDSSSSLELSTSSSGSSSTTTAALPAAFRKAAAISAAAAAAAAQKKISDSSDDDEHHHAALVQKSQAGRAAEVSKSEIALAAREGVSRGNDVEREKTTSADLAPAAASHADVTRSATTFNPSASLRLAAQPSASLAAAGTGAATSPTLRAGADFFFKKADTTSAPAVSIAAPAVLSKFKVRSTHHSNSNNSSSDGEDDHGKNSKGKRQLSHHVPQTSSTIVAASQKVESDRGPMTQTPFAPAHAHSSEAAPSTSTAAAAAAAAAASRNKSATAAAVETAHAGAGPSPTLKTFSLTLKKAAASSVSSSSSSASSSPRRAASPRETGGKSAPPASSSSSSSSSSKFKSRAAPSIPRPAPPPQPPASGKPAETAASIVPLKRLVLEADSDDDDDDDAAKPARSAAASTVKAGITAPPAPLSSSAAAAAAMKPEPPRQTPPLTAAPAVPASSTSIPATAGTAAMLNYNRISARGIGSVPSSVIEAPSRPQRRALPTEHTMSGAATALAPSLLQRSSQDTAQLLLAKNNLHAGEAAKRAAVQSSDISLRSTTTTAASPVSLAVPSRAEESLTSTDGGSVRDSQAGKPSRHAPRTPAPHHAAPPTLLEDGDKEENAVSAESTAALMPSSTLPDTTFRTRENRVSAVTPGVKAAAADAADPGASKPAARLPSSPSSPQRTAEFTGPSQSSYAARAAAAAALQRQREAAIVIYDDRVPPQLRRRKASRSTAAAAAAAAAVGAGAVVPALSEDPVSLQMVLRWPVYGTRASTAGDGARGACRPVLHAGDHSRHSLLGRHLAQQHPDESDENNADAKSRLAGATNGFAEGMEEHDDAEQEKKRPSSQRASSSHSGSSQPRVHQAKAKTHVSDAVLQQLMQQYAPPCKREASNKAGGSSASASGDVPHVIAAGCKGRAAPRELAEVQPNEGPARQLLSSSKRRNLSEAEVVDILNYRATRTNKKL